MSMIIFFGTALIVLIVGFIVISVTFWHWYKEYKLNKNSKKKLTSQETST